MAQLRQHEQSEDAVFTIGSYTFRPSAKLLVAESGTIKVRLTGKEASIARYLLRAGHQPTSRELWLKEVWGYNATVTTHTVETHIYRLRKTMELDASKMEHLITEPDVYRLIR